MIKILIIEDDEAISNLIKLNLEMEAYECVQCYDGHEALERIKVENFDLVLLDVMLPKLDGFTLFKSIKTLEIPTIFLTAKTAVSDRVRGLKMGADDYIIKPFEGIELLARIDNVMRHYKKKKNIIKYKSIELYVDERAVKKEGQAVELTLKEFELLKFLMENKNIVLTREKLLLNIWGYDYIGETRTIDNHIQKLRKKLNLKSDIRTVFGLGYKLEE